MIYQDFMNKPLFRAIYEAIYTHIASKEYIIATTADKYERWQNVTINEFIKTIFNSRGNKRQDFTSSNTRIATNYFYNFNTQRNSYSLGNGVIFQKKDTAEKLGKMFNETIYQAGYSSLIHGVSYLFYNLDKVEYFKLTEFVPLFDENTSQLVAGIRFYQIEQDKPMLITLYEIDGYTEFRLDKEVITLVKEKRPYVTKVTATKADGVIDIKAENYNAFPIVPLYARRLRQSTLIGFREQIDSYDLILSGFANDLKDVAQIFWLINGADGMSEEELSQFRERLLLTHVANVDSDNADIKPYSQEIPFNSRLAFLEKIEQAMYRDFGMINLERLIGGEKTSTEIIAMYQVMDEHASDFEVNIKIALNKILELAKIEDDISFVRNRVINTKEMVEIAIMQAEYIDRKTLLKLFPNIKNEDIDEIIKLKEEEVNEPQIDIE